MQIPNGPNGHPTISVSSLRKYGAGDLRLDNLEDDRGCPRLWKAHYIDRDPAVRDVTTAPLEYGTYWHAIMEAIETGASTPESAPRDVFEAHYPAAFMTEAKTDLENYLARGAAPSDRFAMLACELDLDALLYIDEDFGPIYLRGKLDWIGVDPDTPGVVHVVDWKTNRTPPSDDSVRGDVQLPAYHWLVRENAERFLNPSRIVSHLDAIKWRDVQVAYSERDIEDWHDWAVAVARAILRDDEAAPRLNSGCGWCPIRDTCEPFQALPEASAVLLESMPGDSATDEERLTWRDTANASRLLLEKAVAAVDDTFKARASAQGGLVVGRAQWVVEPRYVNRVDTRALVRVLADPDDLHDLVTVTKAGLERYAEGLNDASRSAQVLATLTREAVGMTTKRKTLKDDA